MVAAALIAATMLAERCAMGSADMRTIQVGLLLIVTFWALSGAAAAQQPPDHVRVAFDRTFIDRSLCTLPIVVHVTGKGQDVVFSNDAGGLVRVVSTSADVKVAFTALGRTLTSVGSGPIIVTFLPDGSVSAIKTAGVGLNVTIAGRGTVIRDLGLLIVDGGGQVLASAGPHDLTAGDIIVFCAAFG